MLEDAITGPIYKTLLERPNNASLLEKLVTSPLSLSVSKINQWVGVYVIFIWLSLIFYSCYKSFDLLISQWLLILVHIIVLIVTIVICVLMICQGKTHKGIHTPRMQIRETKIQG